MTAQLSVEQLDLPETQLRITGVRAQAVPPNRVDPGKAFANFQAGSISDLAAPARLVPLRLAGRLTRLRDATGVAATLTAGDGAAELRVDGRLNGAGGGSADIWIPRIDFAAGGLQPRQILPGLPAWIDAVEGGLGVKGPITWGLAGVTSDIRVVANNLSMVVGGNAISGINGVVEIDGFDPLITAPLQLIGVKTIDIGVPLTDGKFRFDVRAGNRLTIHETSWGLAGGRIGTEGVTLDASSDTHRINFRADGLDLQSLLSLADLDGLTAGGTVSGRIPVLIQKGQIIIRDGILRTVGGGQLRYRPVPMPAALQQGGETVSLMVKALDNFQYDSLQVKLNRDADGEAVLGLKIDGRNPGSVRGLSRRVQSQSDGQARRDTDQGNSDLPDPRCNPRQGRRIVAFSRKGRPLHEHRAELTHLSPARMSLIAIAALRRCRLSADRQGRGADGTHRHQPQRQGRARGPDQDRQGSGRASRREIGSLLSRRPR